MFYLDVPKKSLKSRLGVPKKKNERTGITITLSRNKEERKERRRKRSYDVDSDTASDVMNTHAYAIINAYTF